MENLDTKMDGVRELLATIVGDQTTGYLEIRALSSGPVIQEWLPVTDLDRAEERIAALAPTADVFVGAAPRDREYGGRAAIPHTWALWADCDTPESVNKLGTFTPVPSLTVASGTGGNVHAWWGMRNPVPADAAERAMRRLAHHLGADPRCAEVARIMRPPDTLNHKHDPPTAVRTVQLGEAFHPLSMVADLPDPPQKQAANIPPRARTSDRLAGISPLEYAPRITGRAVNSSGYMQCPVHAGGQERTPSLKLYEDPDKGFHCFGCGWGGDVYAFASAVWRVPTHGAGFVQLRDRLEGELL